MWRKLSCNFMELNLDITLGGGQSFRWTKLDIGHWIGVIENSVFSLKQDENGNLLYFVHRSLNKGSNIDCDSLPSKRRKKTKKEPVYNSSQDSSYFESSLKDYFNLDIKLMDYYNVWSKADENFKKVSEGYNGIRILRQPPVENLFSFICSANNNIPRITSMVEKLCSNYGEKIAECEGKLFYTFPAIRRLAQDDVEAKLRELGFGYRAKYIAQTAKYLHEKKPDNWFTSLRNMPYEKAHEELQALPGVGAKVADCVCLMSLDKYNAIPVDTHIWQVTVKDYLPHLKNAKALTNKIYQQIGDFYRERFGDYAGWANTVLFAADLKMFKK
ncbi:N-glycosylase/DNA lyase isoform X2 [Parasteatoda tepidariorum]|uniref:N-glycosylase/DNA lyase isoform X2 n=1 Tax=Parasteatoda tepidariorum TaxID=114398 RepID=UPI00077FC75F|nr:N-glycosylase/DNA lyase isoform X2 [Parasteatoda tepidariorum]